MGTQVVAGSYSLSDKMMTIVRVQDDTFLMHRDSDSRVEWKVC